MIINGVEDTRVDARDRGLQYGDGCFTTILAANGQLRHWPRHRARLELALERLNIQFPQWPELESALQGLTLSPDKEVVKIVITRGVGGRGYSPQDCEHSQWMISTATFPTSYLKWQKQGIHLERSTVSLAQQPLLAGIKHLNRLEQVLIKQNAQKQLADDVVVCDTQGNLVETSASNLFWLKNGVWYTPNLSLCGVEGVMRNHLLEKMAENGLVTERVFSPESALAQAEAVFVCNSLMHIVPVRSYGSVDYSMDEVISLQERNWC